MGDQVLTLVGQRYLVVRLSGLIVAGRDRLLEAAVKGGTVIDSD
jgi:hypothetical protein